MNNFEKNITHAGSEYALSEMERARMTRVVTQYMKFKPLTRRLSSAHGATWLVYLHRPIAAALVLVLVCGTGISYAAESALPGDALYSVKTNINEPVRIALATSAEAKANVHIDIAQTRLDEATTLLADGRLDTKTQNDLAAAFQSEADAAAENIEKTSVEDSSAAADLASRFETRLAAHDAVIVQVQDDSRSELSNAIRGAGHAVAILRTKAEEKAAVSARVAGTPISAALSIAAKGAPAASTSGTSIAEEAVSRAAALRMRSAAQKQFKNVQKESASTNLDVDVEAQIAAAQDLINQGETQLGDTSFALAFHSFQDSLVITEKLDVLFQVAPTLAKVRTHSNTNAGRNRDHAEIRAAKAPIDIKAGVTTPTIAPASATMSATVNETTTAPTPSAIPPSIQIFPSDEGSENHNSGNLKGNISL